MDTPSDDDFERDRQIFYRAIDTIDTLGDDAPVDRVAIMEAFRTTEDFMVKYRDRMEESGFNVDDFLREIAAQSKTFDAMLAKEDQANEAYLEALARRSEAAAKVIEAEYRILHAYDHRRCADWDAMPPEQKEELQKQMDALRARMPELLASLPIEKRRELKGLE
jgi:hypothetical protein